MRFNLLSDADWDSKVDKVLNSFSELGYRRFFDEKDYGDAIKGITVIFMCRNPELRFKRRIRYSREEKRIYLDIMLDLNQFRQIEQKNREKIITQRLLSEIPPVVAKYKFNDFDLLTFTNDLKQWVERIEFK